VEAAVGGDFGALFAHGVLVDGGDVLVREDVECGRVGVGEVGAGDEGCGHFGPEGELALVFGGAHAVADFEHVGVVPVAGGGVGGEGDVLVEDVEHAGEAGV